MVVVVVVEEEEEEKRMQCRIDQYQFQECLQEYDTYKTSAIIEDCVQSSTGMIIEESLKTVYKAVRACMYDTRGRGGGRKTHRHKR